MKKLHSLLNVVIPDIVSNGWKGTRVRVVKSLNNVIKIDFKRVTDLAIFILGSYVPTGIDCT